MKTSTRRPHFDEQPETRILLLESDGEYREVLRRYLAQSGFAVETAASVREAVLVGIRWKPRVLIASLELDGPLDGVDASIALDRAVPPVAAILLTDESPISPRLRDDLFAVLRKPLKLRELARTVSAAASAAPVTAV